MGSEESDPIATALTFRAGNASDAAQVADAITSILQEIDAALRPIIGQGGVVALYKRSLYLAGLAHPWLAGTHAGVQTAVDPAALKFVLAQQTSADAKAGGGAVLQTFYELLTTLVGSSLTERLLRSVWANPSRATPAQDTSP